MFPIVDGVFNELFAISSRWGVDKLKLAVFKLRKINWLSHGQPDYNIRLSVQVFGCPYLESEKYVYKGDFCLQINGCPLDNCISIFGCPASFLSLAHEQPKF